MTGSFRPVSPKVERAIILYILEHDEALPTELADALKDAPDSIASALMRLVGVGLIVRYDEAFRPTLACRYVNQLDLIDIGHDAAG